MNTHQRIVNRVSAGLFVLFVAAVIICAHTGCSTVTPDRVKPVAASFDGNEQNSGVLSVTPAGYVVTPHFRERYNALVADYGRAFAPVLVTDAGLSRVDEARWLIDRQHMVSFLTMNQWRRMGRAPPKS